MEKTYQNWFEKQFQENLDDQIKFATHLWDEYKYRHELCWNLTFKLTITILTLGVIPYTNIEVVKAIGYWILVAPLLSIIYGVLGSRKLKGELRILEHIRKLYRSLQDEMTVRFYKNRRSSFQSFILRYIYFLIACASINLIFITFFWIAKHP